MSVDLPHTASLAADLNLFFMVVIKVTLCVKGAPVNVYITLKANNLLMDTVRKLFIVLALLIDVVGDLFGLILDIY